MNQVENLYVINNFPNMAFNLFSNSADRRAEAIFNSLNCSNRQKIIHNLLTLTLRNRFLQLRNFINVVVTSSRFTTK